MGTLRYTATGAAILVVSACSETVTTAPQVDDVPFEPDPLDVSVSIDDGRSVSGIVTPDEGGTVVATGADGTTYTLVLPPDAVLEETEVSLTPIAAVSGYPFHAGVTAGVHFQPEGLRLFTSALLYVGLERPLDTPALVAFAYHEQGRDFHIVPAVTQGAVILRIQHFSGVGVGRATEEEQTAQQRRVPRDFESFAQQRMADILAGDQSCMILGTCDGLVDQEQSAAFEELSDGW